MSWYVRKWYTLSEAWSGVNWADLMAAQGAFGTDFYDRSTRTIVGTMLWTEYRPFIKIGPKGALGSHEIHPIHSAPSLGQSIVISVSNEDYTKFYYRDVPGYSLFAVRKEPEPVLRYPSIKARLSTYYLYASSGHLKIKLFPKRQKNFREQCPLLSENGL